MTDRLTSEEREALIARDVRGSVTPGVAADIATLCRLLADPSTWAEPSAGLGDAVVRAVTDAAPVALAPVRPVRAAARHALVRCFAQRLPDVDGDDRSNRQR